MGIRKRAGQHAMKHAGPVVKDVLETKGCVSIEFFGKQIAKIMSFLVAHDVDKHEIHVHGTYSNNVVQQNTLPTEAHGGRTVQFVKEPRRQNGPQPDQQMKDETIRVVLDNETSGWRHGVR